MRRSAISFAVLLALSGSAAAHDPLTGTLESFFGGYQEPPRPISGNCDDVASAIGPEVTWVGNFSGSRRIDIEEFTPFGAQACFESEVECRIWLQQALNYADGPIVVSSCRRGASHW